VTTYRQFKDCERNLEETKGWYATVFLDLDKVIYSHMLFLSANIVALEKENEGDPDMAEMIASELEALSNQLAELEGKLKVNTI
jgi:peptide chain release factor 1